MSEWVYAVSDESGAVRSAKLVPVPARCSCGARWTAVTITAEATWFLCGRCWRLRYLPKWLRQHAVRAEGFTLTSGR